MAGIEEGPLNEAELHELEGVIERHKGLKDVSHGYGVFSSFCIPRLVATIPGLHRDLWQANKERDDALALLRHVTGHSPQSGATLL